MKKIIRSLRKNMGEEKWKIYKQKQNALKVILWRKRTKRKLIEYKGGACKKCGYNKDSPQVYDFHHVDPSKKDFSISCKGRTYSLDRLKKEVDKCVLLCANCHRELHNEEDDRITDENIRIREKEIEDFRTIYCPVV